MPNLRRGMMGAAGAAGGGATTGAMFRTGYNAQGEIGDGTTVDRRGLNPAYVQIGSDTDWAFANGSGHSTDQAATTYGIKEDGSLFLWGSALHGKLGNGTTTPNICSPVQLGAAEWAVAAGGGHFSAAVKTDGTLWTWGRNSDGQLGVGDTTDYSSPVQVGSLTDWSTTIAPVCGHQVMNCIKSDGTLWAWGVGWGGSLGQGNENNQSSPVQVGSYTDWTHCSRNQAPTQTGFQGIRGGTLWFLGNGFSGMNGLGTTTNYSSPVQVGTDSTWKTVEGGRGAFAATKTDGTAWSWGYGYNGMNMRGNTITTSSPIQIGSLTDWDIVKMCSRYSTTALKTDGTIWASGLWTVICGSTGVSKSSPVQIGTSTGWISVTSSYGTTARGLIGTGPVCP